MAADPIVFSDPFAGFLDDLLPNPWETPSVGASDDFTAQLNGPTSLDQSPPIPGIPTSLDLTPPMSGFSFDDSTRRDSLFSYEFDDKQQSIIRSPGPDTSSPATDSTSPDPSTASTSRRPSSSSSDETTPASPTRKPTTRRRRRGAGTDSAEAGGSSHTARRELSLAKNRVAAKKCREKKRDWTTELQERHGELLARNKRLRGELAGLNDAVFELKELVLRHASCGFKPIDKFVRREAGRAVRPAGRGAR
ncbi:hypothetical protein SLS55_000014 [Diplodia seriata]|uniref:BZIP domain-containing protein n=1 Tax=Diplodia seriata TaxID=420778 RepID=A0ABR3CVL8_9PEZI